MTIEFELPTSMTDEEAAQRLNQIVCRLQGDGDKTIDGTGGPFPKQTPRYKQKTWHLDKKSNLFFYVKESDGLGSLGCRREEQGEFLSRVVDTFKQEMEKEWHSSCPCCGNVLELMIEEETVGHPIEVTCTKCGHKYQTKLGVVN